MFMGMTGNYLSAYGLEAGAERMASQGFAGLDFQTLADTNDALYGLSKRAFLRGLRETAERLNDRGVLVSQTHGPWRYPPQDYTKADRRERFEKMARAIAGTRALGSRRFVIHNIMPDGAADKDPAVNREMNRVFFKKLLKVAHDEDVVICLENMPFPEQGLARPADTLSFVREMDDPLFKMCLDTGHCACLGIAPADAVKLIGRDCLYALHIHDNDGAHDCHWLPGEGVADWNAFASALHEIGFSGCLSLECGVKGEPSPERTEKELALAALLKSWMNA